MSDLQATATAKVGANVPSLCGGCKELTPHIVLSMGEKRPLRVRCKVCDRDHNYRLPSKSGGNRPEKKNPDVVEWERLSTGWDAARAKPYASGETFHQGDLITHAQFGLGRVQLVRGTNRMRVLFSTGMKLMVCSAGR